MQPVLQPFRSNVDQGRAVDDPAFAPRFVAALDSAFGTRLRAPRAYLTRMVAVLDRYDPSMRMLVRQIFRPSSSYTSESVCCDAGMLSDYRSRPGLNAVIVVLPDHLPALADQEVISRAQADWIQGRVRADGGAVYALRRSPTAFTYLVAAPASDRAEALLRQLAVSTTTPRPGPGSRAGSCGPRGPATSGQGRPGLVFLTAI